MDINTNCEIFILFQDQYHTINICFYLWLSVSTQALDSDWTLDWGGPELEGRDLSTPVYQGLDVVLEAGQVFLEFLKLLHPLLGLVRIQVFLTVPGGQHVYLSVHVLITSFTVLKELVVEGFEFHMLF